MGKFRNRDGKGKRGGRDRSDSDNRGPNK